MKGALAIVVVLGFAGGFALGDWSDNFDSYANGTNLHGVGGWRGWDNDPLYTAYVTDAEARSTPHSVEIFDLSDLIQEYFGYEAGVWEFSAWQFIPQDYGDASDGYFIILNTYYDGGGQTGNRWSVQMGFRGLDDVIHIDAGSSVPVEVSGLMTRGEWKQIKCIIDFDTDWVDLYYDDVWMAGYVWTTGVFGSDPDGALRIQALDLFANFGTAIYYDDLSLTSAGGDTRGDLNCDGVIDAFDIDPFVLALTNPAGYQAQYPNCNIMNGDINCDGAVDSFDIDAFVQCIVTGTCPPCP